MHILYIGSEENLPIGIIKLYLPTYIHINGQLRGISVEFASIEPTNYKRKIHCLKVFVVVKRYHDHL